MKRYVIWDNDERVFVANLENGTPYYSDNFDDAHEFLDICEANEMVERIDGDCVILEVV